MNASPPFRATDTRRILAIGLDGFEMAVAEPMLAGGRLPNIARLIAGSARFRLHHSGKFTGLGWEHFATGLSPEAQQRWSAVVFDPVTYQIEQRETQTPPFLAGLGERVVVFDPPYFYLNQAPGVRGLTNWGAHDPGTGKESTPPELYAEITERFGPYPAEKWIYGQNWQSAEQTKAAGAALTAAVHKRTEIAQWLFADRMPGWDVAIVVVAEPHSAIEPFWHGVDPSHPLNAVASAPFARAGLESVYEATDALIGSLSASFPDARLLVFSMHGMGNNTGDLPAMALLPELLYRHAFGKPYARPYSWSGALPDGTPLLAENESWDRVMKQVMPARPLTMGERVRRKLFGDDGTARRRLGSNLGWMPAARYSEFWEKMPAFAFPAYYDGQVRLNIKGREAKGTIDPADYAAARQAIVDLVAECRDPITGREVLEHAYLPDKKPGDIVETEVDAYLLFAQGVTGFVHPRLGTIGPFPYRRTGGHTGEWGFLFASGVGPAGDRGVADSYDVAPTMLAMLGRPRAADVSGNSLLPRMAAAPPA